MKVVCWVIVLFSFGGAETEAANKRPRPSSAVLPGAFAGSFTGSAVLPGAAAGSFTGSTVLPGVAAGPFTGSAVLPGVRGFVYGFGGVAGRDRGLVHVLSKKKPRPKGELKPIEFPSPTAGSKNMRSVNVEHTPSEFEARAEGTARRKSNARKMARE